MIWDLLTNQYRCTVILQIVQIKMENVTLYVNRIMTRLFIQKNSGKSLTFGVNNGRMKEKFMKYQNQEKNDLK